MQLACSTAGTGPIVMKFGMGVGDVVTERLVKYGANRPSG